MLVDHIKPGDLLKGRVGSAELLTFHNDCAARNVKPSRRQAARYLARKGQRYCTAQTPVVEQKEAS